MKMLKITFLLVCLAARSLQHGRLYDPPSRSTAWRLGYDTPPNYTDNELFCGGYSHQWGVNGGKCGECGDPYDVPLGERPNQAGGIYATGTITGHYQAGQTIDVHLQITAMHWGWWEFRLCPVPNKDTPALWDCFNEHLLELADGGTRYEIPNEYGPGDFYIGVVLPDISCDQCVLQWLWHTGNSWGADPDGTECVGCGPQETFMGCSDISISGGVGVSTDSPPATEETTTTTTGQVTTTTVQVTTTTTAAGSTTTTTTGSTTTTTSGPTTTTTTPPEPTPSPWPTRISDVECQWVGDDELAGEDMNQWCWETCTHVPPDCDEDFCVCIQNP